MVGRNKGPAFVKIKELEKVVVRKKKPLSQAGREILIKAVAQSFSTYGMRFKKKKKKKTLYAPHKDDEQLGGG